MKYKEEVLKIYPGAFEIHHQYTLKWRIYVLRYGFSNEPISITSKSQEMAWKSAWDFVSREVLNRLEFS
jgi:hypothetical protein